MSSAFLLAAPLAGIGWWLLGFPPGWGWLILPIIPTMPVSLGGVITLATVVIGLYGGAAWLRNNL